MSLIASRFQLQEKIGDGAFGEIYLAYDTKTNSAVAVKIEKPNVNQPQLEIENSIYKALDGAVHIPKCYYYGRVKKNNVLVIDYLSQSLEDLVVKHKTLSLKSVLMLADQMILAVEYMHKRHYVHRDIKPNNFMMGIGKKSNQIYLIDFGLSKKFEDPNTLKHIEYNDKQKLAGTARYASINAMNGIEQSRRDDMESLGYVWIYLLLGKLPWQGIQDKNAKFRFKKITKVKEETPLNVLCNGLHPFFACYLEKVRKLGFEEKPLYSYYRKMIYDSMQRENIVYDYNYDWTVKEEPLRIQNTNTVNFFTRPVRCFCPRVCLNARKSFLSNVNPKIRIDPLHFTKTPGPQPSAKLKIIENLMKPKALTPINNFPPIKRAEKIPSS